METLNPNLLASGVPVKNLVMCYDPRDSTYKGLNIGYFTSGNYITGSTFVITAVSKTGIFRLVALPAKKAIFVNQRDPMYRVYKNNESGTDYLRWIPANSGGWVGRAEVDGIQNLNEIALQVDSTSQSNGFSGLCIAYS